MTEKNTTNNRPEEENESSQHSGTETTENNKPDVEEEKADEEHGKGHAKSKKEKGQDNKIAELEANILELTDRHLRLQAEFDNYRKRTLREKMELVKSGGESVLKNILPVVDDFERAIGAMNDVADDDHSKIGFILIYHKFKEFLKLNNVREIDAVGEEFDVERHFAMLKIPAPSEELKGKITDVIEKGYTLNDKVIRFAKVIIGE